MSENFSELKRLFDLEIEKTQTDGRNQEGAVMHVIFILLKGMPLNVAKQALLKAHLQIEGTAKVGSLDE